MLSLGVDQILSQYESELKRMEAEQVEVDKAYQAVTEKKNDLMGDIHALKQLIFSRKKKMGIATAPESVVAALTPESGVGKSAFIREFLGRNPGATPAEIRRAAIAAKKFTINKAFPYTVLYNWKESEKVEEKQGRYYLKVAE